jgi:hypothetical protein
MIDNYMYLFLLNIRKCDIKASNVLIFIVEFIVILVAKRSVYHFIDCFLKS